jgi:ribosomal protein S18 acetylase RimI-like enzyme
MRHMLTDTQVREIAAGDTRGRNRFIELERELVGSNPLFVAEIDAEVNKRLSGRSAFWQETEHTLLVASDGPDVARCAAMINRRWQCGGREDVGFIGYFAAAPGAEAAVAGMLDVAERWLGERGIKRVIAPFCGDAFHGFATQVDGFDEPPMFPLQWQPPYYPALLEAAGYEPAYPFWAYEIDFTSERYRTVSRRAIDDARCVVRPFRKKRWDQEFETWRRLQNETFRDEWEFHEMTREEYTEFVADFKAVFDERQFLFAEVDGEPVGICWGLPDWTALFRSFKGRMGPLQIARFMLRAKRFDRAGLILIGVLDSHRGKHIGQTLAATLYRYYEERGLKSALYYLVNEENLASRRLAESFGGHGRHLYTAYAKQLS